MTCARASATRSARRTTCQKARRAESATEATRKAVSDMRGQLLNTETTARHIQNELEQGALAWKQAKADFEDERTKFEAARRQLESRLNWRDWLWFALALIGMIGIGIVIGMRIAR